MRKALDFFLFSNLYVGLVVCSHALTTSFFFNLLPDVNYLLLVLFSTLAVYSCHFLLQLRSKVSHSQNPRLEWGGRNKRVLFMFTGISLSVSLVLTYYISVYQLFIILISGMTAIFYVLPTLKMKGKKFKIRDLPYLKLWMISFCVPIVTVMGVAIISEIVILDFIWFFVMQVFFIAGLTIPFDIRDLKTDNSQIKSLPQVVGEKWAKALAIVFVGIYLVISITVFSGQLLSFVIVFILALVVILMTKNQRSEYFYPIAVEGVIISQTVVFYFLA